MHGGLRRGLRQPRHDPVGHGRAAVADRHRAGARTSGPTPSGGSTTARRRPRPTCAGRRCASPSTAVTPSTDPGLECCVNLAPTGARFTQHWWPDRPGRSSPGSATSSVALVRRPPGAASTVGVITAPVSASVEPAAASTSRVTVTASAGPGGEVADLRTWRAWPARRRARGAAARPVDGRRPWRRRARGRRRTRPRPRSGPPLVAVSVTVAWPPEGTGDGAASSVDGQVGPVEGGEADVQRRRVVRPVGRRPASPSPNTGPVHIVPASPPVPSGPADARVVTPVARSRT